ncbi:MAG: PadR family transcriptional regulator, partial [Candidatus Aenigmarchaeota archaeon]|nr:PadR family transcriptional regulator [Candidatus Aenigmarchaeota archaeon]
GYEIITHLKQMTGKNISAGQIYPLLKSLERKNLVRIHALREGRRKRKIYSLTKEGKKFSSDLLSRFSELVDAAVKLKLTSCAHCNCKVYSGGVRKRVGKASKTFCCKYCAGHY